MAHLKTQIYRMCKFSSMITADFKVKLLKDNKPKNRLETTGKLHNLPKGFYLTPYILIVAFFTYLFKDTVP